jgi:hypothetical protein
MKITQFYRSADMGHVFAMHGLCVGTSYSRLYRRVAGRDAT